MNDEMVGQWYRVQSIDREQRAVGPASFSRGQNKLSKRVADLAAFLS